MSLWRRGAGAGRGGSRDRIPGRRIRTALSPDGGVRNPHVDPRGLNALSPVSDAPGAPLTLSEAPADVVRRPSVDELAPGGKQHWIQRGYDPRVYPFDPSVPPRPTAATKPEQPVDAAAEWTRLHDEWARSLPQFGTWIGTDLYFPPVGS